MDLRKQFDYMIKNREHGLHVDAIGKCGIFLDGQLKVMSKKIAQTKFKITCLGWHGTQQYLDCAYTIWPPGKYKLKMGINYQMGGDRTSYAQSFAVQLDKNFLKWGHETCNQLMHVAVRYYHGWVTGARIVPKNDVIYESKYPILFAVYATWLEITPIEVTNPEIELKQNGDYVIVKSNVGGVVKETFAGSIKEYILDPGETKIKIYKNGLFCVDFI